MPVNLYQSTRDLEEIGKMIVANPSVGKKVRHSQFLHPLRRAVQSPGAAASFAFSTVQKLASAATNLIPVPMVGSIVDKAWTKACNLIRQYHHKRKIKYPANLAERVKFELKEIGAQVADWDRFRWKISHAVEQYNKACEELRSSSDKPPCDMWVRFWAKYYYLGSRIGRLRESMEAMRAIMEEVDVWLMQVEENYSRAHTVMEAQYRAEFEQLKKMQVHDNCSDTKCMFKQAEWTSSAFVPTSDAAQFFIKASSAAVKFFDDPIDPLSMLVDNATSLKPV